MTTAYLTIMRNLAGVTLLGCATMTPAAAQEIARLYAAQAPAGSAYVRVVNPAEQALRIDFGGQQESLDGQRRPASDYRIIDAATPMAIKADGKALAALNVKAGSFNTIVVAGGQALLINDSTGERNDLKAELRLYNLVSGCAARLALAQGATVFDHLAYQASTRRYINPVKASLVAGCANGATAAPTVLPPIKPGDHVSLFLTGAGQRLRLWAQVDATDATTGATRGAR